MHALTICQPYASLIANPPHVKRIENRTWETMHRGPIAIHAGKNKKWLSTWDPHRMPQPMPYGAIIAVATLVKCVHLQTALEQIAAGKFLYGWAIPHIQGEHGNGPFCWLLNNIKPLPRPIPCDGCQGLWRVPPAIVEMIRAQGIAVPAAA